MPLMTSFPAATTAAGTSFQVSTPLVAVPPPAEDARAMAWEVGEVGEVGCRFLDLDFECIITNHQISHSDEI